MVAVVTTDMLAKDMSVNPHHGMCAIPPLKALAAYLTSTKRSTEQSGLCSLVTLPLVPCSRFEGALVGEAW